MPDLDELYDAVVAGKRNEAVAATQAALAQQADPLDLIRKCMVPAMDEVGRRFEREEYFVAELLMASRAMKGALDLLRPLLVERGAEPAGRVVIGTVKGDLHDIGKNLVASLLEGGGFEVDDLGTDVPPKKFIEAVRKQGAHIVALSTLLTTTMPALRATIEALRGAGLPGELKIMVGGAPITREYADQIGADGYGENASVAVAVARRLMAGSAPV